MFLADRYRDCMKLCIKKMPNTKKNMTSWPYALRIGVFMGKERKYDAIISITRRKNAILNLHLFICVYTLLLNYTSFVL
jgi:hypothetical protein